MSAGDSHRSSLPESTRDAGKARYAAFSHVNNAARHFWHFDAGLSPPSKELTRGPPELVQRL
jgi:hypothetical protein